MYEHGMNGDTTPSRESDLTRRSFLGAAAAVVGASSLPRVCLADDEKLSIPIGKPRPRVLQAQSARVVEGEQVHSIVLGEMLDASLIRLTDQPSVRQAWQTILKPDDIVGLKFNRSAQAVMGTTNVVAKVIVSSLINNGWAAKRIVCIEAPNGIGTELGTSQAWSGFDVKITDFKSGADNLARVLSQVTAIIDIPFLKTHNIAGMTCALKNLSHALIRHPARYHANGCSPFIADIIAHTSIREKLRLCIVDGMRIMFDGGPAATSSHLSDEGVLLTSRDPVATDAVGLTLLNATRERRKLPSIVDAPEEIAYLADAHRKGLGIALKHGIEHIRVSF